MSNEHIIRAWKDVEYRMNLSEEERAQLPENPVGLIDLTDAEMYTIAGGKRKKPKPKSTASYGRCDFTPVISCDPPISGNPSYDDGDDEGDGYGYE